MKLSEFVNLTGWEMCEYMWNNMNHEKCEIVTDPTFKHLKHQYKMTGPESIGIEPDECGWEIFPCIVDTYYGDHYINNTTYQHAVMIRKKPKFGEVLYFIINHNRKTTTIGCCASNGEDYPIVLLDGEFEYHHGIPLKYHIWDTYKQEEWSDEYRETYSLINKKNKQEFNDPTLPYILFPEKPNIHNLKTSKFRISEYGEKVERFAEMVSKDKEWLKNFRGEGLDKFQYKEWSTKKVIDDNVLKKCFASLHYRYPEITEEDFNNVRKLLTSEAPVMEKFIKKCKIKLVRDERYYDAKDWTEEMFSDYFDCIYDYIYPKYVIPKLSIYDAVFSHLDEFRNICRDIGNIGIDFTALYKAVNGEVRNKKKGIYDVLEKDIRKVVNPIRKELKDILGKYNGLIKEANKSVKNSYSDRLDMKKVKKIDEINEDNIISLLSKALREQEKDKRQEERDDSLSDEFKQHLNYFFNLFPDKEHIRYSCVGKVEDAPYEIYERNDNVLNEEYSILAESIGEYDANEWLDKFGKFVDKELTLLSVGDGHDLYPGCSRYLYITRNFDFGEEDVSSY